MSTMPDDDDYEDEDDSHGPSSTRPPEPAAKEYKETFWEKLSEGFWQLVIVISVVTFLGGLSFWMLFYGIPFIVNWHRTY